MKALLFSATYILMGGLNVFAQVVYNPMTVYDGTGQLFDIETVTVVELDFYDANYHDTLTNRWFSDNDERLPASIVVGTETYDSVGVRYKGNSTFYLADLTNNPKVPYNIDINYYVGGQKIKGYKKLKLANAYLDPTFAKEASASHIYRHYMPTPQAAFVKLYVNDNYLGMYVNTESVNKQFLDKHFRDKNGAFMKCEPTAQFASGDPFVPADLLWRGSTDSMDYYESYEKKSDGAVGWPEFVHLIDVLNNDPTNIENVLNVDRVLWFLAVSTILPNEDTYNTHIIHNYYFYQTGDGKWQIIPWDLSETYGGALIGNDGGPDVHYFRDPQYGFSPYQVDRPLVYQLLSIEKYKKRFFQHVRTIMDEFYDPIAIKDWVLAFQATGYAGINSDPNRTFSMTQFVSNIDNIVYYFFTQIGGITSTIIERGPFLESHAEVVKVPPTIHFVEQNIANPSSTEVVYISTKVTGATEVNLRVTATDEKYTSDFIAISMVDDGTSGDLIAGDNIFTAAVPFTASNSHVKYYVEALNNDAAELSPRRAEYFYYHYYVDQVLDEAEWDFSMTVFPNPATDLLQIKSEENLKLAELYDINGRIILSLELNQTNAMLDVSELPTGNYILKIATENRTISKPIIIE